nr:MAG TPA: hypothetical protein [Caudoviricetes sp.]
MCIISCVHGITSFSHNYSRLSVYNQLQNRNCMVSFLFDIDNKHKIV